MSMDPDPQGQQRPGLFARIGNFFGAGDPNAGTPTDPFADLSRAQRVMLGFGALRDAAAALEGRDTSFFNEALGGFETARERERLRTQGEFANRNQQLLALVQLQALGRATEDPSLTNYATSMLQQLMGGAAAVPGMPTPAVVRDGGTVPVPAGGGGQMPPVQQPPARQGVPQTGVEIDPVTGETRPYDGAPEVVQPAPPTPAPAPAVAPAPSDPLAQINAQIAEQERTINQLIGNLPGRDRVLAGQLSGLDVNISPQEQAALNFALEERNRLMADREALAEAAPAREAAARENEAEARQARYYRNLIESVMNDPALPGVVGRVEGRIDPRSTAGIVFNDPEMNVIGQLEQLQGAVFLEAFQSLRGGGQITQVEGEKAERAIARINQRAVSPEAYRGALEELRQIYANAEARALGQELPFPEISVAGPDRPAGGDAGILPEDQDLLNRYLR